MDGLFFYRCFRVSKYMTRSILYVLESGFFFFTVNHMIIYLIHAVLFYDFTFVFNF